MSERKNDSGRGQRNLKVRVKTAKGRKTGSTKWLKRQLNDLYIEEAKKQGYRSRAAFKIKEIERADITKLHSAMSETPYAANRVLALLSKAFELAEVWSYRAENTNPCRKIKR